MPTYCRATKETAAQVRRVLKQYHGVLADAGVTCDILMAHAKLDANGDPVGAAVTKGGYPCIGVVKVMPLKDRAAGRADAEIVLDGDRWDELSAEEQDAAIDHELTHLELVVDDSGLRRDDLDRPNLRIRKHDHQFGWFDCVARRHGTASFEWRQYEQFTEVSYKQLWLTGMEPAEVT